MAKQTKCSYQHHAIATGGPSFAELKQRSLIDERLRGTDQHSDFLN